jgi:hypothetical protein
VGAVPFLKLMGIVAGGWMMARSALAAGRHMASGSTDSFYPAKMASAEFFATNILPQAAGLARVVVGGGASALAIPEADL